MFEAVREKRQFGRVNISRGLSLPIRGILLLAFLMITLTIAVAIAVLVDSRKRELAHSKGEIVSLSGILAEQTTRTFEGVALMMRSAQERLSDNVGQTLPLDSLPVTWLLRSRIAGLAQVKSMFVVDRDGFGVNSSRPDFISRLAMSERPFFRHFADGATDELFISRPEKAKVDGEWTFYVSSRLLDARGGFRGVLIAAIRIDYFESLYDGIDLDFVDKIQLLNSEGVLLAGKPRHDGHFAADEGYSDALAELRKGEKNVFVGSKLLPDGERFIAYRKVANYPLVISAAVDEQEALTPWRQVAKPIIGGVLLVVTCVLGAAALLVRNLMRQELLSTALADSDEQLRHMVLSVRDAIVTVDAQRRIALLNPAAARLFGVAAERVVGRDMDEWLACCAHPPIGKELQRYLQEGLYSPAGLALLGIVELKDGPRKLPVELSLSSTLINGQILLTAVFRDLGERQRAEQELLEKNRQLEKLSASLQDVRENERTRIARELHDELGQLLTGIRMEVSWLGTRLPPEQPLLLNKVTAVKHLIDQTIASVRRISSELRPLVLDDLGFVAAARWYVDQFAARTGLGIDLDLPEEYLQHDADLATALFRILQESLTNIARHAQASEIRIALKQCGNDWELTIADDGVGFAPQTLRRDGFGLIGMRERARSLGGRFTVLSAPGQGSTIVVLIPIETIQEA